MINLYKLLQYDKKLDSPAEKLPVTGGGLAVISFSDLKGDRLWHSIKCVQDMFSVHIADKQKCSTKLIATFFSLSKTIVPALS